MGSTVRQEISQMQAQRGGMAILSQNFRAQTVENHESPQSGYSNTGPRIETKLSDDEVER
jgi:hypothetical protein